MTFPDPQTCDQQDEARYRGHLGEDAHFARHADPDLPCFDECLGCEDELAYQRLLAEMVGTGCRGS